ncbi:MAG: hypothetical protein K8S13_04870 [Desulfobacula sp.]|uniref:hypothetical protein n=1 Tax=Desulfobacula sp. TaxID=2593537 RepID=UPI0025BC3D55|nr:hypothetical protein [Desulfobacula sp.]MCD4719179.1 hypothetical protein [Desulfobacula sp.]
MKGRTDIPWCSAEEWNQVFLFIKRIDDLHGQKLVNVYKTANQIRHRFEEMSGSIEKVCSHTCVYCEDICCIRATIWFDLKDLLYIYFGLNKFPASQIIKNSSGNRKKACCHFFEKGCALSRLERPFICTWYFCSEQKRYLTRHHQKIKQNFEQILIEIKNLRNKMEEEFIRISYPNL